MIINTFGLHHVGGIPFLVQADGVTNLISPELGNPFSLKLPLRGIQCPHDIKLDGASMSEPEWLQDPLVQALLPVPGPVGGRVKMLRDPNDRYAQIIQSLLRLSSPTEPMVQPVWWQSPFTGRRRYMASNITPIVWTAVTISHIDSLIEHCDMTRVFNRTTVVVAREELPLYRGMERIETGLTRVPDGDFEAIGAGVLRRWMEDGEQDTHSAGHVSE